MTGLYKPTRHRNESTTTTKSRGHIPIIKDKVLANVRTEPGKLQQAGARYTYAKGKPGDHECMIHKT
jgi:hypothetical protein